MKQAINKVTGLQVGYTTEWVVFDSGVWRTLTTEEKALAETEYANELLAKEQAEKVAEAYKYLQDTDFYFTVDKYATLTPDKKLELETLRAEARVVINNGGK